MKAETFQDFKEFIEGNVGIKIPPSKKIMLESRLAKRLRALGLDSYEAYRDYVFGTEGFALEIQQLIDTVTTNETDFFRESAHFDFLTSTALPELYEKMGVRDFRLWSVAASTGQESYTLAMVMEEFGRTGPTVQYRILATDISEKVLAIGAAGVYTENQGKKIPLALQRAYCLRSKNRELKSLRFKPEIRDHIQFRHLNLMDGDYHISKKYHVIFCRNVFIYFDRATQGRVLEKICSVLVPGGYLFMGHSETIGGASPLLESVASAVYRKRGQE